MTNLFDVACERLEREKKKPDMVEVMGPIPAVRYWQDLACANRKVAEDNQTKLAAAQAQRDKARDDALEQAAKVCDKWSKRNDDVGGYCAAAIRAMKKEER